MYFEKKKGYFKYLENHLKNPDIQSYYDLLTNYSFPHKTIFKIPKNDSLYESVLFAYLEQQIILNKIVSLDSIIKLIESDTSDIYEWPHWNSNKNIIKSIIFNLKEKMLASPTNPKEVLDYLYKLKENKFEFEAKDQQFLPFQSYLNILMRYIIMTHIIVNRDKYFANLDVMRKFFETTKIYSLQQGFSEIALGFLPMIFDMNFKLFCWEKKDESNNNLNLKKKYFITKDENWKEKPTICLIQNEDMISYRFLPSRDLEQVFYKRVTEDFCGCFNDLIKSIVKYYNNYVQVGVTHLKNEFDIFNKKTDPFELLFYENHDLEEINGFYTKITGLLSAHDITSPQFSGVINDFVFEKTNQIEKNFKELHTYIQKVNQYSGYNLLEPKKQDNYNVSDNKKIFYQDKKFDTSEKNFDKYLIYDSKIDPAQNYKFVEESKAQNQTNSNFKEDTKNPYMIKNLHYNAANIHINKKAEITNNNVYKKPLTPPYKTNDYSYNDNPYDVIKKPEIVGKNIIFDPLRENAQNLYRDNILGNEPKNLPKEEQKFTENIKKIDKIPQNIPQERKIQCPICSSDVSVDENIITLECEHKICRDCLSGWLMAKYDLGQWDLENFKCFLPECNKTIDIHILKHIIGDEKFTKMCDKLVEKLCFNCPYNECRNFFMNEMKNEPKIQCPKCNKAICTKCNEKFHDSKACPKLFNIALNALKNEKLNVCPECFEVYLKDDKCAHVKCMKCSTEFCFECSCPRIPTLSHGNHYHRLDCKFFFEKEDTKTKKPIRTDEYDPKNCKICKETGKPCKRPISYKEFYNKFIKEKK